LVITDDKDSVADYTASLVMKRIVDHNASEDRPFLLGLPTGSTPLGMYEKLIQMHRFNPEKYSFKNVITFNMDEYVFPETSTGKPSAKNPNSYHFFMWHNFFQHIDILPENVHILDGDGKTAEQLEEECRDYEKIIRDMRGNVAEGESQGVDLFLGGIGPDGHIAFNEPGSSLASRTRMKTLAVDTVEANKKHFKKIVWDPIAEDPISKKLSQDKRNPRLAGNNGDGGTPVKEWGFFVEDTSGAKASNADVPSTALTVGVATVMDAKEVMILVTGQNKANALEKCIEEGVSHQWTVSMMQMHARSIFVVDEDATAEMRVRTVDYYKGLKDVHYQMLGEFNPHNQGHPLHNSGAEKVAPATGAGAPAQPATEAAHRSEIKACLTKKKRPTSSFTERLEATSGLGGAVWSIAFPVMVATVLGFVLGRHSARPL